MAEGEFKDHSGNRPDSGVKGQTSTLGAEVPHLITLGGDEAGESTTPPNCTPDVILKGEQNNLTWGGRGSENGTMTEGKYSKEP